MKASRFLVDMPGRDRSARRVVPRSSILASHWIFLRTFAVLWVLSIGGFAALAQELVPSDVGTTVNGFQDDFDGSSLNTNWVVAGDNVFSVSGGLLHVNSAAGDPNHLLYELP